MYNDITGIILAGGKSSRMGMNKSFLDMGGMTIIERISSLLQSVFTKNIIITNLPHEYASLGLPTYEDIYKDNGPLAGIHSGLVHSATEKNFVLSCDVPLMTKNMIEYIIEFPTSRPVVFCNAAGYHQPLVGLYKRIIVEILEKFMSIRSDSADTSFHQFLKMVNAEIISPDDKLFENRKIFFNVNSPEDYKAFRKMLSKT